MYTCANCTVLACANNEPEKMPKNCPMRNASVMEAARAGYDLPENHDFYVNCSAIEGLGLLPVAPPEGDGGVLQTDGLP